MNRYQAEQEIESNLRAGALEEYLDGDTALQYLGDLMKLFTARAPRGVPMMEHLRMVNMAVAGRLSQIADKITSDNVDFVMCAENEYAAHARSEYRALTSEQVH
jgi:hypothetical protein